MSEFCLTPHGSKGPEPPVDMPSKKRKLIQERLIGALNMRLAHTVGCPNRVYDHGIVP